MYYYSSSAHKSRLPTTTTKNRSPSNAKAAHSRKTSMPKTEAARSQKKLPCTCIEADNGCEEQSQSEILIRQFKNSPEASQIYISGSQLIVETVRNRQQTAQVEPK